MVSKIIKVLLLFFLVVVRSTGANEQNIQDCPHNCTCTSYLSRGSSIDCGNTDKIRVPRLPRDCLLVSMSHNAITEITRENFRWYTNLEKIDLSSNSIHSLDRNSLHDQTELKYLDLSHNPLNNFTINLIGNGARSLEILNLSSITLFKFPVFKLDEGVSAEKLQVLILSDNLIREIDSRQLPGSLRELDLSCNDIRHLDLSGAVVMEDLVKLSVRGCNYRKFRLSSVARFTFEKIPNLKFLDLSNNQLFGIPNNIPATLEYLFLDYNEISKVKKGDCASDEDILEDTQLRFNSQGLPTTEVSNVGSELSHLIELRQLDLSGNQIEMLCLDDFIYMENMLNLNLSSNRITSYQHFTFPYARSLQVLDLSNNQLTNLIMPDNADLTEFYVQRNSIQTVPEFVLRSRNLKKADFSDNDYTCDCHLETFWKFLMFSYSTDIPHSAPNSVRYNCARPPLVEGKSLLSMRSSTLTCDEHVETDFPIFAVAAPASLFLFIFIIVIFIVCGRKRRGEDVCCSCRSDDNNEDQEIDLIAMRQRVKEIAIFCHQLNESWVMNPMIAKLEHHRTNIIQANTNETYKPLNLNLFTIGESIKVNVLHQCIDTYRKLVLVITHEFLHQDTCLYVTSVIADHICSTTKDAVLVVIADHLGWEDLPKELQLLITEKTFVEYPQNQRLYETFWENLCLEVNKVCEDDDDLEDEEIPRVSGGVMSKSRAARLKRLGITATGEVSTSIQEAVAKARLAANGEGEEKSETAAQGGILGSRKTSKTVSINESPVIKEFIPLETRAPQSAYEYEDSPDDIEIPFTSSNNAVLRKDIEEFKIKREMEKLRLERNVRSLLPADCDDVASVYSDQSDNDVPKSFRPGGRHHMQQQRPLPATPIERSVSQAERKLSKHHGNVNPAFDPIIHRSSQDNLHGSVHPAPIHPLPPAPPVPPRENEEDETMDATEEVFEEVDEVEERKSKKSSKSLISFFK